MESYTMQGADRQDCETKIMEKFHNRPFKILRTRETRIGGFLGLFSKLGVEVEYYFLPMSVKTPVWQGGYQSNTPVSWQVSDTQQRHYLGEQVSRNEALDFAEEKKKVIGVAGKNPLLAAAFGGGEESKKILESLNEIKEKIETGARREEHPAFARVKEILKLNDFSEKFTCGILERMRKELPLETLDDHDAVGDHLLEWIGESISIYNEEEKQGKGRVMVLVGPTGVGKTTTIAKLARYFGISETQALSVRMITIDAFRIGAREQLEKYGNIMDIPVSYIDNRQDLRKEIALHAEKTDLFLVDTIGKSPKDSRILGEMKEILDGCGRKAQTHLVFSASTKTSDIEDILRQFEPFNYRSVVLTKMDETCHFGNVISALAEKKKPVSYITDGQEVHSYLTEATVAYFLVSLDDIKVDREKIEKRFPVGEADLFR
ncbi:MAG: AAA family ATPase [Treponema sp.]|nr:AAA family ATPase [Treponema sp.]